MLIGNKGGLVNQRAVQRKGKFEQDKWTNMPKHSQNVENAFLGTARDHMRKSQRESGAENNKEANRQIIPSDLI